MKESGGGFSLFNIVIFFVLVFTGYVSLSINYSKAYNVKNEIINIIKNQGGVCTDDSGSGTICSNFADQITDYFKEASYRSTRDCDIYDGWIGYSRTGELLPEGKDSAFCVKGIKANSNSELPNALYYKVKVFYQLDLPIISRIFEFSVSGETARVYSPNECANDPASYSWC